MKTLDRKRAVHADLGAVGRRIHSAAKLLLSLARKLPPPATRVLDALQPALDKLCRANYPRIDKHHAAWFPSLPVLLTAWVACGSLALQDLQLFSARFGSILGMPPPIAAPTVRPLPESPIFDLTGLKDPEPQAPQPSLKDLPILTQGPHASPPRFSECPEGAPPVLNGFLTRLNAFDDKPVGSLARAFHLTMQLAACEIPKFLHDFLRHQWELLRASLPLAPVVTKVIAEFAKAHPQGDPSTPAAGQHLALQAQKTNQATGSSSLGG